MVETFWLYLRNLLSSHTLFSGGGGFDVGVVLCKCAASGVNCGLEKRDIQVGGKSWLVVQRAGQCLWQKLHDLEGVRTKKGERRERVVIESKVVSSSPLVDRLYKLENRVCIIYFNQAISQVMQQINSTNERMEEDLIPFVVRIFDFVTLSVLFALPRFLV